MFNQHNKWTIWFKLLHISVIVIAFGLLCLLVGYWTAFIKYVRIIATTRGFHHLPYELYFICSGALFAIIGSFIYTRVTRTIDRFNERLSNYILFNNRLQPQPQPQLQPQPQPNRQNHQHRKHYYPHEQQQQQQQISSSINNGNRAMVIHITHDVDKS
ncbi:uncharacterized protein LOC142597747 [Dermatophagoides farinae]|uniref:uncharacterized protein LOC142597747 n=1 Tax=Dermatophagoides farinae TaxID=6954 RepID=UPI003F6112EC